MESGLKIQSNFPLCPYGSWEEMPLNDFFRGKLQELGLKMYPTHQNCLGPILSGESILVTSPSGTYRSSLSIIGLIHLVDPFMPKLQVIALNPRKGLVDEYTATLQSYSAGLGLKIIKCVGGEKNSKQELKNAQVAVCSSGKLLSLIQTHQLDITYVKILILDVANSLFYKDMKVQTDRILAIMPDSAIYWYLSPVSDDIATESYKKKKPDGKIIEILDERVLHAVKFFLKFYETEEDQFEFIKKRCENFNGQVIVYSCQVDELERLLVYLADFDPCAINDNVDERNQKKIKEEFTEGRKKILICYGNFHYARKVHCKGSVEIFNLDIAPPELLVTRVRRSNYTDRDKCICFFKEYEEEEIRVLENAKEIKFMIISDTNRLE